MNNQKKHGEATARGALWSSEPKKTVKRGIGRGFPALILGLLAGALAAAPSFSAPAIAIFDAGTGAYLYRKGSGLQRAPASTIKVLTALTAVELEKDLERPLPISARAAGVPPSQAGLRAGERYRLKDLLAAMLVASSNDAAVAIAEGLAGSEAAFAKAMEDHARQLGATRTRVVNASGLPLPEGMATTNEDSLLFILALRRNPELADFMAEKEITLRSLEGREIRLANHNRLLWSKSIPVRGKTGYTRLARHCFLSWASFEGRSVAVSVLGAKSAPLLWRDVRNAYDFAFKGAKSNRPVTTGTGTGIFLPAYMRSRGLSLKELQDALARAGFPLAIPESEYGPETRRQVQAFQKSRRLSADGVAGPQTWRSLRRD